MLEERPEGVALRVRVQPKASRDAFFRGPDGSLRAALTAPPVDGAANAALIALAAAHLGIPRRQVTLWRGDKSREKTLLIAGLDAAAVRAALDRLK